MSQPIQQDYEVVIGLEVHLQLSTQTKIFCGCANLFGAEANTLTCPVCLGLPGSLPVVNRKAIDYAIKLGVALDCRINSFVKFDRKNYFYPDCPKNYQISQFDYPICSDGLITIVKADGEIKKIRIKRAHLEEDAGKLIHDTDGSLIDFNRTGTPLIEIVTEPDIRSSQEAYEYLQTLKWTLSYLDISDCDMEKGSLRCDANISIRERGATHLNSKTELKNMNSFKAVKTALDYEIERHKMMHANKEKVLQETRLWDDAQGVTVLMRSKEDAHDYRYFPEPDLVPFILKDSDIAAVKNKIPELPLQKLERMMNQYGLSEYDAKIIVQDRRFADFYEECAKDYKEYKKIANWMCGAVLKELNDRKVAIGEISLTPAGLVGLIKKVEEGALSNLAGKDVLTHVINDKKSVDEVISEKGLAQVSDEGALEKVVDEVIQENEKVVAQVKEGKESAVGFLVGQAMKKSKGKANPKKIGEILRRRIIS